VRILLFLPELAVGGAERQFVQLAGRLAAGGDEVVLATQRDGGALVAALPPGVRHSALFPPPRGRAAGAAQLVRAPRRLRELADELAPDVAYSALFVANMQAHRALARGGPPLAWGFRTAHRAIPGVPRLAYRYARRHAPEIALSIFNSEAGLEHHLRDGFRPRAARVIQNGLDLDAFRPDPAAGARSRAALGLPPAAFVVGMVARLVPLKGHEDFLVAASELASACPAAAFVCVGDGDPVFAERLRERARELGLEGRVRFPGALSDVAGAYNALDVLASCSSVEGFSNAIGEALASGVPCAVTDVGDSARVVAEAGRVVAPGDPAAMARAWLELERLGPAARLELGAAGRARVEREFDLGRCARLTREALAELAAAPQRG